MQFIDDCAEDEEDVSDDEDDGSSVGSFVTSEGGDSDEEVQSRGTLKRKRLKRSDYEEKQTVRQKRLQKEVLNLLAHPPDFVAVRRSDVHARRTNDLAKGNRAAVHLENDEETTDVSVEYPVPVQSYICAAPSKPLHVEVCAEPLNPVCVGKHKVDAVPRKKQRVADPLRYQCDREFKPFKKKPAPTAAEQWMRVGLGYQKPVVAPYVPDISLQTFKSGLTTADILNPAISKLDFTKPKDYIP